MSEKPVVGMGATYVGWSDRHPYTVIEVAPNGKRCKVQEDKSIRVDNNGMSDDQEYRYEPDSEGQVRTLSLRADGTWREVNSDCTFVIGHRRRYHDYSH